MARARGRGGSGLPALLRRARAWRGAALRPGDQLRARHPQQPAARGLRRGVDASAIDSGGGGPLLDRRSTTTREHTRPTTRGGWSPPRSARRPPEPALPLLRSRRRPTHATRAASALRPDDAATLVGVHVSGGRAIKQWDRHASPRSRARLRATRGATIVLTGAPDDAALRRDASSAALPAAAVIDASGDIDLLDAGGAARALDLLVTGDTGRCTSRPPSARRSSRSSAPRIRPATRRAAATHRVVRVDLPCSPCNRIRLPPAALRRPHARLPGRRDRRRRVVGRGAAALTALERCAARLRRARMTPRDPHAASGRRAPTSRRRSGRYLDAATQRAGRRARPTPGSRAAPRRRRRTCRCATASPTAATRCGGSPSCTCTSSRSSRHDLPDDRRTRSALIEREQPQSLHCRIRGELGWRDGCRRRSPPRPGSRQRAATVRPVGSARRLAPRSTRGPRRLQLPLRRRHASRSRRRQWTGHRPDAVAAFVHAAFWRSDQATAAPRRTSARCWRRSKRARAERPAATSAWVRRRTSARGAGGIRCARRAREPRGNAGRGLEPFAALAPQRSPALAARGTRLRRALVAERQTFARALDRSRLRLLAARPRGAGGRRALAVALVGAGDGRSGGGARRARARASRHLRRSGRLGTRAGARIPAPRHPDGRPAARLHLPPLAELPARSRRDGRRRAQPPTIAAFRVPT